jgi:hypothetical protein
MNCTENERRFLDRIKQMMMPTYEGSKCFVTKKRMFDGDFLYFYPKDFPDIDLKALVEGEDET